uniref:Uncharacterized protein n=1 Tax=Arundo donax TaxID=35708 RepID=A0A0A9C043_ARUDO
MSVFFWYLSSFISCPLVLFQLCWVDAT